MSTAPLHPRAAPAPPGYADRLRREGLFLAVCSGLAAALVAALDSPMLDLLFAVQFVVGVGLLLVLGPRAARRAMAGAEDLAGRPPGSGEPTPLWHLAAIVAVLTPLLTLVVDGLAGLSFAVGAGLVGLAQAFVLRRVVTEEEQRSGRRHVRRPGSRIGRGTKLGFDGSRG